MLEIQVLVTSRVDPRRMSGSGCDNNNIKKFGSLHFATGSMDRSTMGIGYSSLGVASLMFL